MSQPEPGSDVPREAGEAGEPATARAEAVMENVGRRIGLFAARASRSVQNAANYVRQEADRMDQPQTEPGKKSNQPGIAHAEESGKLAMERAEESVDRLGKRISSTAMFTSLHVQRAAARVREEAEDIWADAQNVRRNNNSRKP
jgi:hypothetical protein